MNIQDIEVKTGLTKRMIRHYEEFGLLSPQREENGYRNYTEEDLNRLLCIKAMREVGFSLAEIASALKDDNSEETFKRHLQELLLNQQEKFREQQERIQIIKKVLKSNPAQSNLLDKIALINAPAKKFEGIDDLERFLQKRHVVHGYIPAVEEFRNHAKFGNKEEFKITNVKYCKFGSLFHEGDLSRASIALCKELYAYVLLFSGNDEKYGPDFHRKVFGQFTDQWSKHSHPLTVRFNALTDEVESLAKVISTFDIAVCITAEDSNGSQIDIVIPGQQLTVYLSQKAGEEYNTEDWMKSNFG